MFANYKKQSGMMLKSVMGLGMIAFLGLVVSWAVYIFMDDDKDLRLVATAFTTAFSGCITFMALISCFMSGLFESPLDGDGNDSDANMYNKIVQHPATARVLSLLYIVSVGIYLVIGQMIGEAGITDRDPSAVGLGNAELELLNKEDQWHNIMFFSSLVSNFPFFLFK